jgi:hypothetical protein
MKILKIFLFFLLLSGCSFKPFVNSPIIGLTTWKKNEAIKYYNEGLDELYKSVKTAIKDMDMIIENEVKEENYCKITAINSSKKVFITIQSEKSYIMGVKIKMDPPVDASYAQTIFDQIDLNLNSIEYDRQGRSKLKKWNLIN